MFSGNNRSIKVFAAALVSILVGAVVLRGLDSGRPVAGAFALSDYYGLNAIEGVVSSGDWQLVKEWGGIEINYGGRYGILSSRSGDGGVLNYEDINYHFIIWDGVVGRDGEIEATGRWERQIGASQIQLMGVGEGIIRVCVIVDDANISPSEFQIKRVEALTEVLCRRFEIDPSSIYYPDNWW